MGRTVIALDGVESRRPKDLKISSGALLLRLPPYGPEKNSMENVFGHLKSSKLANSSFDTIGDVCEAVLKAWTEFAGRPTGSPQ